LVHDGSVPASCAGGRNSRCAPDSAGGLLLPVG
jgi:hypothetical protein